MIILVSSFVADILFVDLIHINNKTFLDVYESKFQNNFIYFTRF